ncbi:Transcriptional activator feaR [Serratia proteamaculans]|jgi:AraC family transcriptional activator of tynA and feaB|uniref:transcriptional regulator FeaR n=1 Tax=Serratia proteamaculans TaxID=28151 RepID=UPI00217BF6A5|nr:transcriptional regulator FeaR [Serratia proteamaculans]CAI0701836.1 Transcriptional activator feaR [Serratia proteamaculans]CAI1508254.1 Transcriptional activator feaR [Serratia proteamaculans]CAI1508304.1 Transcriptional activator feaR [Serratia proteamaculans]CAI1712664.1 Transcriptional activator feaR [Serratia proteamaculans]CAI1880205.1 Transcriptional activator feaR [Serratia proteamaculans]
MAISAQVREVGFEEWLAKINSACGRFCAKTLGPGFSGAMQEFRAHALRLSVVDAAQTRLYRTQQEIARSDGSHFFTVFQLRGSSLMEQGDRQAVLSAGDVTLIDASRTSSFTFQQNSRQISLLMPRSYLEQSASEVQYARRLDAQSSVVRLSRQLVLGCMQDSQMSAPESEAILNAVATLLRPALVERVVEEDRHPRSFSRTLAFIDTHIQSPQLRPEWIAGELGVSVRSLYRMFARQGLVVAQYIKHRRLDLCAQALRSAPDRQKLATIGYDWGFSDHSHFSTAFKSRFGVSPSEYRKQHQ